MKKEVVKKSPYPFYLAGAGWLIYSLILPFYRLTDILIAAALSAAIFWVGSKVFAPVREVVEVDEVFSATGDKLADEMISKGQALLKQIRSANNRIDHPELSDQISRLEEICSQIFKEVQRRPRKAPLIRRSLDYYLPVILKLLDAYGQMDGRVVHGSNIQATMEKIEGIMDKVLSAFSNQLDSLYKDEALDISTDITVLQGMLVQEGLLSDGMAQAAQSGEGAGQGNANLTL